MKKLKLFPKTFLYTLLMLLLINLSLHGMIYFFYPRVCLHRAEKNLEKQIDELQERLLTGEEARQGELFYDFAREKQVNLTVETPGGAKTYQGLGFQISLLQNADTVFQVSNLDGAQAIIVKSRALRQTDGSELQVEVMASARPLKEATDMIRFLLPVTFVITIGFSVIFAYFYSKKITDPIVNMLKVTTDMKDRKPRAAFCVQTGDELETLAAHVNEVYQCLLSTIRQLDEEKERMLEVEKAKTVFLRSASHELKTPLAGLRILLENMQYGVGKYKDRDTYLPQAVEKVDELTEMVKNILDTSRQQETLPANVVAVKKEVDTVLNNYAMQIAEKALEVRAEFSPELTICMPETDFRQIWSNLVSNAVRYTPAGGSIRMGVEDVDAKRRLWIENTCMPLDEESLKYIFEPFYRPDATRNMQGGSGLGLYVVAELLKKAGSAFGFVPVAGGMRFWMEAPGTGR